MLASRAIALRSPDATSDKSKSANTSNMLKSWEVATPDATYSFDHVVIATAPQHLEALLPTSHALAELRSDINALAWEPIATAYLQYPAEIRLPEPLIALNHGTAQWLADRGQLGGPSGLLAHVLSAHGDWEDLSNDALIGDLHDTSNEVFRQSGFSTPLPAPLKALVIREQRATFRCVPHIKRPMGRTALPGLWLAGDYIASDYPGTLEAAVRSGEAAATGILAACGPA